jgi:hypothetical protein
MPDISKRDRAILWELRNDGLIEEVVEDYIRTYGKVVDIMCCDPYRYSDAFRHVCEMLPEEGKHPVVFPLSFLGGALILAPDSQVLPHGSTMDRDWLAAIKMAHEVFGIKAVLGKAHVACAMAYGKNLDAFRVCEMNLAVKRRVESEVPGITYIPLLHTASFKRDRMLTYHIPAKRWERMTREEMFATA